MTDEEMDQPPPVVPRRSIGRGARMAKPLSRPMELSEAPVVDPVGVRGATPGERKRQPKPEVDPPVKLEVSPEPEPEPVAAIVAEAQDPPLGAVEPAITASDLPATVRETLRRVDAAWRAFHAVAARFPSERMDAHLNEDGWTVKQMLAHIAAWHDLTADRLVKFLSTGRPAGLDQDPDAFNALVARRAIGKTAGEILNDTEATFNRLRRQMQRLTDAQLRTSDSWAAWVIRGNTYGHYEEHWADIYTPEPLPGSGRR
jgi:hypothetical protein